MMWRSNSAGGPVYVCVGACYKDVAKIIDR